MDCTPALMGAYIANIVFPVTILLLFVIPLSIVAWVAAVKAVKGKLF